MCINLRRLAREPETLFACVCPIVSYNRPFVAAIGALPTCFWRENLMKHGLIARRVTVVVLGIAGLLSLSVRGQAQVTQPASPPAPGEFRFPEFATVVKDMQVSSGLFTIYRHKS